VSPCVQTLGAALVTAQPTQLMESLLSKFEPQFSVADFFRHAFFVTPIYSVLRKHWLTLVVDLRVGGGVHLVDSSWRRIEEASIKNDRHTMGENIVTRLELLANHVVAGLAPGAEHEQAQAFANRVSNDQMPVMVHTLAPQQEYTQCGFFCHNIVQQVMRMQRTDPLVSDRPGMWAAPHAGIQAFQTSLQTQFCAAYEPDPNWAATHTVAQMWQLRSCDLYRPVEDLRMKAPAQAAQQVDICLAAETARREDHQHTA